MKKNIILEEINKINKVVNKIPTTLNETLMFHEDEEFENDFSDSLGDEIEIGNEEIPLENNNGDVIINKIRKMALEGLSQLADNPDSIQYSTLKQIWSTCDKEISKKSADTQKNVSQQ